MTRLRLPLGAAILMLLSVATSAQAPIKTIVGYGKGGNPDALSGKGGNPIAYAAVTQCNAVAGGIRARAVCLSYPADVAVGRDGTIYYSEYSRVRKLDSTGAVTTVAGGRGPQCLLACFDFIAGLAVDRDGNLLISEYWGDRVFK